MDGKQSRARQPELATESRFSAGATTLKSTPARRTPNQLIRELVRHILTGHMPTARRPPKKKRRTARTVSPSDILDILNRLDDIEKTLSIQLQRMAAMQAQIDHNAARLRS
jgi:hypothetical protein